MGGPRRVVLIRARAAVAVGAVCTAVGLGCGDPPSAPSRTSGAVAVASVQPDTAPSGFEVRLYGSGFHQGLAVTFGGVPATVTGVFGSQATVLTPDHLPGKVDVAVTNPGLETATLPAGFTFIPFEITEITPNAGFPGLRFWVNGTGFMPGARVKIGGVDATAGQLTSTTLVGVAPEHPLGPADLVVTNMAGRSVTLGGGFTYYPSPVITVTPTVVPAGGQLNVSWVVSLTSGFDWVGLYRLGADNVDYLSYKYISGLTGTTTFTAPTEPGQYEFRYLPLDRYEDYARTGIVTVTPSSAPINRAASGSSSRAGKPGSRRLHRFGDAGAAHRDE